MGSARLNITLPEEMMAELDALVGPRRKSRFIALTLRDRLNELRTERLRKEMIEGYLSRSGEGIDLSNEFEAVDLEGWDED